MPSITKLFFGLATLSAAAEVCVDTVGWTLVRENRTFGCDHFTNESVCANGMCIETTIGKLCGQDFNFPELNCCACGKATLTAVEVEEKLQSADDAVESSLAEAQDAKATAENEASTAVAATESAVESAKAEAASAVASAQNSAASAVASAEDSTASALEAAQAQASSAVEAGAAMAKDAVDAVEKAAEKLTDGITLEQTTLAEQECDCECDCASDCQCGSCGCSDAETAVEVDADVDTIPTQTGPSVVLIFGILFAIGSCCSFVAAWHYGIGRGSWACLPCRKRVPCDDGYERIPTTAHLFKDQEGPADYTSWSYGSTQGRMMAA